MNLIALKIKTKRLTRTDKSIPRVAHVTLARVTKFSLCWSHVCTDCILSITEIVTFTLVDICRRTENYVTGSLLMVALPRSAR